MVEEIVIQDPNELSEMAQDSIQNEYTDSQQLVKTLAIINYLKAIVFIIIGAIICKQ